MVIYKNILSRYTRQCKTNKDKRVERSWKNAQEDVD